MEGGARAATMWLEQGSSTAGLEITGMGFTERLYVEDSLEPISMLQLLLLLCGMD